MSATFTLTVATGDLLTANQRLDRWTKGTRTRNLRQRAYYATRAAGAQPMQRAHLTVWVTWPDNRRRDVDGVSPTVKAAIDGAVDAGMLPDDNARHLPAVTYALDTDGEPRKGHVVLRFVFEEVA